MTGFLLTILAIAAIVALRKLAAARQATLGRIYGQVAPEVASDRPFALTWFGPGSTLVVSGIALRDPCLYASRAVKRASDPGEVRLDDPVKRGVAQDLPYWPWYSDADPAQRHAYLTWLAAGRDALPEIEGFVFLWFYGLERRLLVDRQDLPIVGDRVLSLLALDAPRRGTKAGRSLRRYAAGLLWIAVAREPDAFDRATIERMIGATPEFEEDSLAAALAWAARGAHPIPDALAMHVAEIQPRAVRGSVRKKVGERFPELFGKRLRERFPSGFGVESGKRIRRVSYRPANAALREVAATIADPLAKSEQFAPLVEIWNSCVEDLRKLGRIGGADGVLTIDAWEALPGEIREETEHPAAAAIRERCARVEESADEIPLIVVRELAAVLEIELRVRFTANQSRRIALAVEAAGFCLEPDCRITGKAYGCDELVAIYVDADESGTGCDPARFQAAATMLRLGLEVATADGKCDEEELRQLSQEIEAAFQLTDTERRRLDALRAMLVRAGTDTRAVAKRLEATMPLAARENLGKLLVAIAAASRDIDRKETQALRKCYRALGLAPEALEAAIAELAPKRSEDFVPVATGANGQEPGGEAIPPPPEAAVRLDPHAVHRILAETREVARLLADAMATSDEDATDSVATPTQEVATATLTHAPPREEDPAARSAEVATASRLPEPANAPPERYRAFHSALIARRSWPRSDAEALARQHGLMLSGAIEALNDWALDTTGVPLIDETDSTLEL